MEAYQILIVIGIIFLIIEIFIPSFIAGSIAIGFLLAALGSFLNFDIKWQIFLFSIGVILTFFTIRPVLLKYGYKASKKIRTNQEALIGRVARVSEIIDNKVNTGRVELDGDVWRAKSSDESIISIGAFVEILEVKSIILIVKPLN